MTPDAFLLILMASAFALAVPGTLFVRALAVRRGLMDHPSQRSSHTVPTPRGGGLAIVAIQFGALAVLCALGYNTFRESITLIAAGGVVAFVGFLDDHRSVAATARLVVHLAAAMVVVSTIGGVPMPGLDVSPGGDSWVGRLVGVIGIAWVINLFNFMDGIDGIAGSEAVFVSLAAAAMIFFSRGDVGIVGSLGALGMASLGFLVWNWPPARIFMGDVGSGFLGFMLAALALIASRRSMVTMQVWPILGGVFIIDASVTLVRRIVRGDKWYEAHRMHAYQHLARVWGRHYAVTIFVLAVNVCWLLPWAWYAAAHPPAATLCLGAALLPLMAGAVWAGAGRP